MFPAGRLPPPEDDGPQFLGDIVLAAPVVLQQCRDLRVGADERIPLLMAHGLLHLLHYDHETAADYRRMRQREAGLLKRYTRLLPSYVDLHPRFAHTLREVQRLHRE